MQSLAEEKEKVASQVEVRVTYVYEGPFHWWIHGGATRGCSPPIA